MKLSEVKRFAALYERHLKLLKLKGKSDSTTSVLSSLVCRILLALSASRLRYFFGHIALLFSLSRASQETKIAAQSYNI